jgi:hypothetical protein
MPESNVPVVARILVDRDVAGVATADCVTLLSTIIAGDGIVTVAVADGELKVLGSLITPVSKNCEGCGIVTGALTNDLVTLTSTTLAGAGIVTAPVTEGET